MALQAPGTNHLQAAVTEPPTAGIERLDHGLFAINPHGRDRGRERMWFRPVRRGQQKHPRRPVRRRTEFHQLTASRQRRDGEAVRHRFTPAGQVGGDPVGRLAATDVPAESGNQFIENQDGPMRVADPTHFGQVAVARFVVSGRLQDHRRDLVGMIGEKLAQAPWIVVGKPECPFADRGRDARRHRCGRDEPIFERKEGVVLATGDQVPSGGGAGQADRGRGRVGAVLAKLDHVAGRHQFQQAFRRDDFERRGAGEVHAVFQFGPDRRHDGLERMPQRDRTIARGEFDVPIAVGVPDMTALATDEEPGGQLRVFRIGFRMAMSAARNHLAGAGSPLLRTFESTFRNHLDRWERATVERVGMRLFPRSGCAECWPRHANGADERKMVFVSVPTWSM